MTSIRRNAIDTCYPDPYRAGPGTRLMMAQNLSQAGLAALGVVVGTLALAALIVTALAAFAPHLLRGALGA